MILFVILGCVVLVCAVVSAWAMQADWNGLSAASFTVAVCAAGLLGLCAFVATMEKVYIGQALADAASLRESAALVDPDKSEDVFGKVADFNRDLAQKKWSNRTWWEGPFIPDEWDTVSVIPIRRASR